MDEKITIDKLIKKAGKSKKPGKPKWTLLPKENGILSEHKIEILKNRLGNWIGGHISLTKYWIYREYYDQYLCFQCFLHNNHAHFTDGVLNKYEEANYRFKSKNPRIVHSSYVTFPWSSKETTMVKSIKDIHIASKCMNILNINILVIHLSRNFHIIKDFDKILLLCLEACVSPTMIAFEPVGNLPSIREELSPEPILNIIKICENIREIIKNSDKKYNWGICLDTAHSFVTGQKITSKSDVQYLISMIEKNNIPIVAIHLNGSIFPFNSGRDKHTDVASPYDHIWAKDKGGLIKLVKWAKKKSIPMILERPERGNPISYFNEIERIKLLIKNNHELL